jgi:hypothetical protein
MDDRIKERIKPLLSLHGEPNAALSTTTIALNAVRRQFNFDISPMDPIFSSHSR